MLEIRHQLSVHHSGQARLQYLTDLCGTLLDKSPIHPVVRYRVFDRPVCLNAFALLHGCSPWLVLKARGMAIRGESVAPHGNTGKAPAPKQEHVRAWLQEIRDFQCEHPSKDRFIIPDFCLAWTHVYRWFQADHPELAVPQNYFFSIRKKFFPDLHLHVHDDFAHCDTCSFLRELIHTDAPKDRPVHEQQLAEHLKAARDERVLNFSTQAEAKAGHALHVFVDGSKSAYLPHEARHEEVSLNLPALQSQLSDCFAERGARVRCQRASGWLSGKWQRRALRVSFSGQVQARR